MKVVILCGGKGTRLKEKTQSMPKPLIEIGGRPILWHIMKLYQNAGFNEFILCLGYKGEMIKDYFTELAQSQDSEPWKIIFAETGEETSTGGRVKKIESQIQEDFFMLTYGDGVSNLNIKQLVEFHKSHGKMGTVTAVRPPSQFGLLDIGMDGSVQSFREKPKMEDWINGGFFVFNRVFFNYLAADDILEKSPLEKLSQQNQLVAFKHDGFWKCMDTYKDTIDLNELWNSANAPWATWRK